MAMSLTCDHSIYRNAQGLSEVITLSRSFVSVIAKAKTAKISEF